jgi:hypothetical protein
MNRDEPRAAATFVPEVHEAAALMTFPLSGLRYFCQGGSQGCEKRITFHLGLQEAVIVSMVPIVPPGCAPLNYGGMVYQQCGGAWHQPQGTQFIVVNPPN